MGGAAPVFVEDDSLDEQPESVADTAQVAGYYGIEDTQQAVVTQLGFERSVAMLQDSKRIEKTTSELKDMAISALAEIQAQGEVIEHIYQAAIETEINTDTGCLLIEKATLRVRAATNRTALFLIIAIFCLIYVDYRH